MQLSKELATPLRKLPVIPPAVSTQRAGVPAADILAPARIRTHRHLPRHRHPLLRLPEAGQAAPLLLSLLSLQVSRQEHKPSPIPQFKAEHLPQDRQLKTLRFKRTQVCPKMDVLPRWILRLAAQGTARAPQSIRMEPDAALFLQRSGQAVKRQSPIPLHSTGPKGSTRKEPWGAWIIRESGTEHQDPLLQCLRVALGVLPRLTELYPGLVHGCLWQQQEWPLTSETNTPRMKAPMKRCGIVHRSNRTGPPKYHSRQVSAEEKAESHTHLLRFLPRGSPAETWELVRRLPA